MKSDWARRIDELITTYDSVVKVVDKDAREDADRAYGGIVRSVKGRLQEHITEEIIRMTWESLGGEDERLSIDSRKHKIPIQTQYIANLDDPEVRQYLLANVSDYFFGLSVDKQVYIDRNLVVGIECKAYTENAMIKRILVDFSLLKTMFPTMGCYLFQLESQLGGDYCALQERTFGSRSTHTLMSYFPEVKLNIFTFLIGERRVDEPIHRLGYFKRLKKEQIENAVSLLAGDLKEYL